jgi:aspartyl/asparaginyl beta-hydroxylase (cupin superfamily)
VLYYPYLAQRQFFEREEFGWVAELEAATPAIREELLALVEGDADFRPYVENNPDRPHRDFHGLNENRDWTALYLWRDGKLVEENAGRCPKTVAALEKVPLSRIGSRTPAVLFSRLEPGAHIPPHSGMLNCRLICHLPLIVPRGCWLRVGNETREWEEGKLLIFDDSIEHEAKNPTGELRIILLFDIWRPELREEERTAISGIFDAIDRFQGIPED